MLRLIFVTIGILTITQGKSMTYNVKVRFLPREFIIERGALLLFRVQPGLNAAWNFATTTGEVVAERDLQPGESPRINLPTFFVIDGTANVEIDRPGKVEGMLGRMAVRRSSDGTLFYQSSANSGVKSRKANWSLVRCQST
jgi:hypothetical protein